MNRVTSIGIYDYERTKLCDLYDSNGNISGQAYNISWEKNMDGIPTLSFTIPYKVDGEKNFRWKYLRSEYLIRMVRGSKTEWFIAAKPIRSKSSKEIVGTVTCNGFPAILKTKNIYQTFDDENGIGTVDYLLGQILTGTGWSLGFCETLYEADGSTIKVRSLKSDGKQGALGLINTVCNLFKCHPVYDSENMQVNIYALNRHEKAIEIEVGRNTGTMSVNDNSEDIVTRLYVEGEYGDYGYVGIDDVNPTGLSYIFNFDYYREIGLFGPTHETALATYITDARTVKNQISANQEMQIEYEEQANNLIGQCRLVVYYTATGFINPKFIYGNPSEEEQTLSVGDEVVVLNSNGTFRYATIETTPAALIQTGDYGIAKFATKAAGSIGAKEVQIEAKQKEIANLQRKINATTKPDKIAEYTAEIAQLNIEIHTIYTETDGLYEQMHTVMKSDGILYHIDYHRQIYNSLIEQQLEIEATFASAMGNLLRDGYWQNNNYIPGQEEALYADACEMSDQMAFPKTGYTLKYIRTEDDIDTEIDDLDLNDIAHIIDDDLEINDNLYIKKIVIGIDKEEDGSIDVDNNEVTLTGNDLGSVLSRMSQLSDLIEQKNALYERAKAISSSGTLYTDRLNGQIDVLKIKLLSTVSNWETDENGNIIFLSVDGSSAMMLSGAGFMIANSKDDNDDWVWRTFGTGEGFTADEIVAGFISAERIEAGSIATSKLEPDVGNTLVISGNPAITQINNQIAPGFSTETSYVTGDLVMKDGIVYIFTSDHPAGAWDDSDVLATNVATQIELLPDKIIQYVGQQGYGRTFIQWTDPALDPEKNVAPGDYWIKQDPNTGTWGVIRNKTWGAVKDSTWYDLMNKMPEMYCRKGSGLEAEWVPVNDTKAVSEAYTRIEQTQYAIIQEAHRANAAEGELDSKIIQTAEGILNEVSNGYIAKTSTYQTADAIVTTAEQYTANQLTNYYTKTETASQISTSLTSYAYGKSEVYTKTETASQITTSISSSLGNYYTKTETASQISTYVGNHAYGLVSGITINANGISMTGSKYITLESSGYVKIQNWSFTNNGFVHSNGTNDDFTFCQATSVYTNPPTGLYYGRDNAGTTVIKLLSRASNNGAVTFVVEKNSDGSVGRFRPEIDYGANIGDGSHHINALYVRDLYGGPGTGGAGPKLILYPDSSNSTYGVVIESNTTNSRTQMRQVSSSAYLYITGYISAPSSVEYKHNIQNIKNTGIIIDSLRPVTFAYNNDLTEKMKYGLIYEEAIEVLPEICNDDDTTKSIDYTMLVPILLKEIQNLRQRVKQLER